jgi:hydroxymethylbilane synthase
MSSFSAQRPLVIGTRGSDLALTQARMVEAALKGSGLAADAVEIRIVKTIGDKRPDLKLSEFAKVQPDGSAPVVDKGIFTKELEEALKAEAVDIAVHSLKDVPTELADEFFIAATLPRAPIEDVLLTRENLSDDPAQAVAALPGGATVATSSVRRARQLRWLRPDLEVVDIRGNVPTRVRKLLDTGEWAATMLARAGLERLEILPVGAAEFDFEGRPVHAAVLPAGHFLPAAGQGAVGIEMLRKNSAALAAVELINHQPTFQRVTAERAFLARLQAGCQTPVGAHTWFAEDGKLRMKVRVFDEDDESADPNDAAAVASADAPEQLVDALMANLQPTL